ncbi:MAG: hypothetical protein HFJ12_07565 [Bacilli bacterium]|nr:hypothetical protein [Bacilli bacterium]
MNDKNILIKIGIIIYIVMTSINKFIVSIPNIVYIPIAISGIVLMLIGFFKDKRKIGIYHLN